MQFRCGGCVAKYEDGESLLAHCKATGHSELAADAMANADALMLPPSTASSAVRHSQRKCRPSSRVTASIAIGGGDATAMLDAAASAMSASAPVAAPAPVPLAAVVNRITSPALGPSAGARGKSPSVKPMSASLVAQAMANAALPPTGKKLSKGRSPSASPRLGPLSSHKSPKMPTPTPSPLLKVQSPALDAMSQLLLLSADDPDLLDEIQGDPSKLDMPLNQEFGLVNKSPVLAALGALGSPMTHSRKADATMAALALSSPLMRGNSGNNSGGKGSDPSKKRKSPEHVPLSSAALANSGSGSRKRSRSSSMEPTFLARPAADSDTEMEPVHALAVDADDDDEDEGKRVDEPVSRKLSFAGMASQPAPNPVSPSISIATVKAAAAAAAAAKQHTQQLQRQTVAQDGTGWISVGTPSTPSSQPVFAQAANLFPSPMLQSSSSPLQQAINAKLSEVASQPQVPSMALLQQMLASGDLFSPQNAKIAEMALAFAAILTSRQNVEGGANASVAPGAEIPSVVPIPMQRPNGSAAASASKGSRSEAAAGAGHDPMETEDESNGDQDDHDDDDEEGDEDDDCDDDEKSESSMSSAALAAALAGGRAEGDAAKRSAPKAGNGSGSSCHQCKSRRHMSNLIFCCNMFTKRPGKGKRRVCRKKYCGQCLIKFYNETPPECGQDPTHNWPCPACRGMCCCALCRRVRTNVPEAEQSWHEPADVDPATSLAFGLVYYSKAPMLGQHEKYRLDALWDKWIHMPSGAARASATLEKLAELPMPQRSTSGTVASHHSSDSTGSAGTVVKVEQSIEPRSVSSSPAPSPPSQSPAAQSPSVSSRTAPGMEATPASAPGSALRPTAKDVVVAVATVSGNTPQMRAMSLQQPHQNHHQSQQKMDDGQAVAALVAASADARQAAALRSSTPDDSASASGSGSVSMSPESESELPDGELALVHAHTA